MNPENRQNSFDSGQAMQGVFDHEKLDVYQLALRFLTWVTPLLEEASKKANARAREVCDQLDRASLSILLNTAEGNGRRQRPVRAKFFDDARGSGTECAACLDALVAKQLVGSGRVVEGKNMLLRIVSMLSRLVDRFDNSQHLHEDVDSGVLLESPQIASRVSYRGRSRTSTRTRTRTKRS